MPRQDAYPSGPRRIESRNIAELAERVVAEQKIDKGQARKVIECALKAVVGTAKGGAEVILAGFGKFTVKEWHERARRKPVSGEVMAFAGSRKVAFAPVKAVKEALNG